jgi:hypothetical protein
MSFGIPVRNGLGVGLMASTTLASLRSFSPSYLFASGAQGAWYDPSVFSTLFQDSAGTTPVTAVEQPVRLMLDRSGRGNHALAPNDASRPMLRARYNLFTFSEQFDNAVWVKNAATVTANATTAPDGTATADTLQATAGTGTSPRVADTAVVTVNGSVYTASMYVKAGTYTFFQIFINSQGNEWANFTLTGAGSASANGASTATIQSVSAGWYRISMTYTAGSVDRRPFFMMAASASATRGQTWNPVGTETVFIWGAQFLTAADQTATGGAYQRIAAATDYDTNNSVFRPYLAFDGTDDSFGTSSIDFSATDEMTVFAGVTKLSDVTAAALVELTATPNTSNGTFTLLAPSGNGLADYGFYTKGDGTQRGVVLGSNPAPSTAVLTGISDISTPVVTLRVNATQTGTNTLSQGAGNFANAALFIGRRNNATIPLNGRIYSMIVLGRAATAVELTATETWVNGKTGAY